MMDRIHLGNVWVAFLSCFDQIWGSLLLACCWPAGPGPLARPLQVHGQGGTYVGAMGLKLAQTPPHYPNRSRPARVLGGPLCLEIVSVPADLGPDCVPRSETKKLAVSRARQAESRFRGHFCPVRTPTFGGFRPLSCLVVSVLCSTYTDAHAWFPPLRLAQTHR